jgi:hypothetical protein
MASFAEGLQQPNTKLSDLRSSVAWLEYRLWPAEAGTPTAAACSRTLAKRSQATGTLRLLAALIRR